MESFILCFPANDMLTIFYTNFYENSSFNEKKKYLFCLTNQYLGYLENEVPILTYFLKSTRKIKKKEV